MKPFFTYYGGKYRAAPKYPAPIYNRIVEPFAGSAGYAVRYPHKEIILIDKDEKICGVWDYLINASKYDILSLPNIQPNQTVDDLSVGQSEKWLIGFWLNKGAAQPCKKPSAWMRAGSHDSSFWGDAIKQRIAVQCEKISHWQIIQGSYNSYDFGRATYFVDPPYYDMGRHYKHGANDIDFSALASWCQSQIGQVIVCENTGATWLPFVHFMDAKATESKNGGKISKEAIWINNS